MTWQGDAIVTAIASFGGASVVVLGLSAFAGRVFSDQLVERLKGELSRDLETHRIRLRKSEVLFARELESVTQFVSFSRRMRPHYSHPEMDKNETWDEIALNIGSHECFLEGFLAEHGAVISDKAIELLSEASEIAGRHKFEAISDGREHVVSREANAAAVMFWEKIKEAERRLLEDVRSQVAP